METETKTFFYIFDPADGKFLTMYVKFYYALEGVSPTIWNESNSADILAAIKRSKHLNTIISQATTANPDNWVPKLMDANDPDVIKGRIDRFTMNPITQQVVKMSDQNYTNLVEFNRKKSWIGKIVSDELNREKSKQTLDNNKITSLETSLTNLKNLTIEDEEDLYLENFLV